MVANRKHHSIFIIIEKKRFYELKKIGASPLERRVNGNAVTLSALHQRSQSTLLNGGSNAAQKPNKERGQAVHGIAF
jgi:hypothetical protein